MKPIDSFTGEHEFLSNFSWVEVEYDGEIYPSVEHAYQAAKTLDLDRRLLIKQARTPGQAKQAGRNRKTVKRDDWDDVKLNIMEYLLRQKFSHPVMRTRLLATGDAELIEGNNWGDTFWGVCRGVGKNHLGKMLMRIRRQLRIAEEILD